MQNAVQGSVKPFNAADWKIGIVVAQFNQDITHTQLAGALKRASEYGISEDNIEVIEVAGAMEIPLALQYLAKQGKHALLALGCVIKGDTPHFDYVCKLAMEGILRVQLDHSVAIGVGVITCNTHEQAVERAELAGEHLDAALQLANIINGV